jgi:3-deoxy-manno-octulosonate cytidylyltransferase (CMP-KDO synthetase)
VVVDDHKNALYFSRSPIPYLANIPLEKWLDNGTYYKHIGIYAWRRDTLSTLLDLSPSELEKNEALEQLRWLYHGFKIRTVESSIETPNIDVPEDVEKVLDELEREA